MLHHKCITSDICMSDITWLNNFFSAADNFFAEKTNRALLHSAHSNNRFVLVACCMTTLNRIFALQYLPVFSDGLADSSVSLLNTSENSL